MILAEDGSGGSGLLTFLPLILIIVAFYFLLVRPQSKRRREQLELQSTLAPGDEVRTTSGLYGTIVATADDTVTIEAAPGVELRFVRGAIDRVIPKPVEEDESDESDEAETDETDTDERRKDSA